MVYSRLILLLLVLLNSNIAVAEQAHDHHHDMTTSKLSLNNGQQWLIDESLHTGMTRIKNSLAASLSDIHHDAFTTEQYQTLAAEMLQHIQYLFSNCKLPARADAQLHILLARIMQGIAKMQHNEQPRDGAIMIIQALQDYPVYFADKKWQGLFH